MTVLKELLKVTQAALEYIDAIPDEAANSFPTMPGFDRDWADNVVMSAEDEVADGGCVSLLTCDECGGKMGKHFLGCSVWGHKKI